MEKAKSLFNQYLKEKGIRQSSQRDHILDTFLRTEKHLTAVELYGIVKKKYPNVGYATVYRAIKVMRESGLADEIDFGDGVKRFEHKYGHEHHDHLICLNCGKYVEVMDPEIEKLQKNMAKKYEFTLERHKMHLFGVCKECDSKKH